MDTSTMFENMFLSMDDEMFRLRAADIADIRTGILAELLGKEVVDLFRPAPRTPSLSCTTSRRP